MTIRHQHGSPDITRRPKGQKRPLYPRSADMTLERIYIVSHHLYCYHNKYKKKRSRTNIMVCLPRVSCQCYAVPAGHCEYVDSAMVTLVVMR